MEEHNILKEEMLEIRDEKGTPTGIIKPRSLVHRDGDLHGCSHIWVVRLREPAEGETGYQMQVLLQRRSRNKDSFPGLLDISSAGHLDPGETYESGAWRELSEELGIREEDIAGGRLRYLFMFRNEYQTEFYGKPFHDNELDAVYLAEVNQPESFFSPQPEEIEEVIWMDAKKVLEEKRARNPEYCLPRWEFEELYPHLQAFEKFANEGHEWTWKEYIRKNYQNGKPQAHN